MATLLELRTKVRERADMVNSQFVSDNEVTGYVNASAGELYDLLISSYEDYFLTSSTFSLASGVSQQSLPADFYKLRGLDLQASDGAFETLHTFNFQERNERQRLSARFSARERRVQYRVLGNSIRMVPANEAAGNYQLWYIPRLVKLVGDADVLAGVLDWEEYVVVDAAIKCLQKEESDVSVLMAQKQALIARITTLSSDRDSSGPETIFDVNRCDYDGW